MKIGRSKAEYMYINEREDNGMTRMPEADVIGSEKSKHLGSIVKSNREC